MPKSMKRSATSDLNRDNWDQDDEPEEAGTFKAVGQEELSKRVIKLARRRLPKTSDDQRPLFTNFTAFGTNKPTTTDPKSSFSFLANLNGSGTASKPITSTSSTNKTTNNTIETDSTQNNLSKDSSKNTSSNVNNGNTVDKSKSESLLNNPSSPKTQKEKEYLENIKALNEGLIEWLNTCILKNPSGILTPIFSDYENHLEKLKKSLEENNEVTKTTNEPVVEKKEISPKEESTNPSETTLNFKFNTVSSSSSGLTKTPESSALTAENVLSKSSSPISNTASFGLKLAANKTSSPVPAITSNSWMSSSAVSKSNVFANLAASTNVKPSPLFGNISSNPLLTPSNSANKDTPKEEAKDEDDDQTPVNDFKPVTEDDALFSQRVKLFVQKDKQYSDRGVGTLFIKEAVDGKGNTVHQATIRADTNLGNIIFNMRITKDIPTKRVGKNNVMLVCASNSLPEAKGPADPKTDDKEKKPHPVTVLFRVKTSEEADKLLEEIKKYK